jgi:LytS/YehU family sensor histidine kinase
MLLFKSLFVVIISLLFAYIVHLIYKQQEIALENQRLQAENLENRLNALISQVNPHFFFNSLNSLSYLVRDGLYEKSLNYIEGLSDIFRYVLKNSRQELVLLADEIHFLEAFRYLLEIRFEDKLFFDLKINQEDLDRYKLPAISLQPVIENVVKHNVISEEQPMRIGIFISDDNMLLISNSIQLKTGVEGSTGIGLENLNDRYRLLLNKGIDINISKSIYTVKLPMVQV